jgi:hypothetical protein
MKSAFLLTFFTLVLLSHLAGQSSSRKDKARFSAIIRFTEHPNLRQKGKLYATHDSAISLINPYVYKTQYRSQLKNSDIGLVIPESELLKFQVVQIDQVYLRKDGNIIKGILAGALVGALAGYFAGQSSGDDPPGLGFRYTADQKSGQYGLLLGITGGIAGGIIGANIRVSLPFRGNQQEYRRFRPRMDIYKLEGEP